MLCRALFALTFSLTIAHACDCANPSVKIKLDRSDVVFRGTITALRDADKPAGIPLGLAADTNKIVVFRVMRVWKGDVVPR